MMRLHSQVMPPDGGINQEAIKKLFGSSSNPWSVFFREVFQNSNDARIANDSPFEFIMEVGHLPASALTLIKPIIQKVEKFPAWKGLSDYVSRGDHRTLVVVDRNTSGLDGGLRLSEDKIRSNFADFFFRLGRDTSRDSGGGAFGFGRNVFFQTSTTNSIFVYTRFKNGSGTGSRFMGMSAGTHYHDGSQNLTGRHWWGAQDEELPIAPFTGVQADDLADTFGIKTVLGDATGTAIVVLGPATDDIDSLALKLRTCAEIYAWPHLLPINDSGEPSCEFTFISNGKLLEGINPRDSESPVNGYFLSALGTEGNLTQVLDIKLERNLGAKTVELLKLPKEHKQLGRLTYVSLPSAILAPVEELYIECGLPEKSSIALYRDAKIVVKYLPIQNMDPQLRINGFFQVDPAYFRTFRDAENLTHDTWDHDLLGIAPGNTNPVKIALARISDHFSPNTESGNTQLGQNGGDAYVSDQVGKFLEGVFGGGSFLPPLDPPSGRGRGGGGGARRPVLEPLSRAIKSANAELAIGTFVFSCLQKVKSDDFTCNIKALTALGNGDVESQKDSPNGLPAPEVKTISTSDGLQLENGFNFNQIGLESIIEVTVEFPRDSRVQLAIEISKVNQDGK